MSVTLVNKNAPKFKVSETNVTDGVAVLPYGAVIAPTDTDDIIVTAEYMGEVYESNATDVDEFTVGGTVTLTKVVPVV